MQSLLNEVLYFNFEYDSMRHDALMPKKESG